MSSFFYDNPEMDEIYQILDNLYIGAYWPQLNFDKMEREGITAIVNLMEEKLYKPPKKFVYLYKGFPDESYPSHSFIEEIFDFLEYHLHQKKGKVLVHCAMGISRSGGIVTGWLLRENPNWTWSEAVEYVRRYRNIFPAVEIRESILDYLEILEGRRRQY
ncbi:MAG: hypothetical protein EU544_05105 [Promethearchaeota archaeon]|nr:MAG: hypothetical protein EU544_05105 [Candidatus Lokiarchaeota archaeon]